MHDSNQKILQAGIKLHFAIGHQFHIIEIQFCIYIGRVIKSANLLSETALLQHSKIIAHVCHKKQRLDPYRIY